MASLQYSLWGIHLAYKYRKIVKITKKIREKNLDIIEKLHLIWRNFWDIRKISKCQKAKTKSWKFVHIRRCRKISFQFEFFFFQIYQKKSWNYRGQGFVYFWQLRFDKLICQIKISQKVRKNCEFCDFFEICRIHKKVIFTLTME